MPISIAVHSFQIQAFFNVMLREFGVKGVKVKEIVSLDTDILARLPLVHALEFPWSVLSYALAGAQFTDSSSSSSGGKMTLLSRKPPVHLMSGLPIRYVELEYHINLYVT